MTTVFIAGSINVKHLHPKVQARMMNIIVSDYAVLVGDADGVDTAIQQFLHENGARNATVYCTGGKPRNNVGNWPVHCVTSYHPKGCRAYFTAKDIEMAEAADVGLMIWDAKSTGTLSNVVELLSRKRNSLVFLDKEKQFHKVSNIDELEALVGGMADADRLKADSKIGLLDRIAALRSRALQMDILQRAEAAALSLDD
jgi:hypothetical protein